MDTNHIRIVTTFRRQGEAVQNFELFSRAWDECIELQVQDKETWAGRVLSQFQGMCRYEVAALHGDEPVGAVLVAHDPWDAHVGPCCSVFAQYVLPEHRLQGISPKLMREAIKIARDTGHNTLAFTHRQGPWRYLTQYRRLK